MRAVHIIAIAAILAATATGLRANDDRLQDATAVLTEMTGMQDNDIPTALLAKAKCVVIIPSVKKAALGVGGQ